MPAKALCGPDEVNEQATILAVLDRIREDGSTTAHRLAEMSARVDIQRESLDRIEQKQDRLEGRIRELETATAGAGKAQEIGGKVALVVVGAVVAWLVSTALG